MRRLKKVEENNVMERKGAGVNELMQKSLPNMLIDYPNCNVETTVDKVISNPIFFFENKEDPKKNHFIGFASPMNNIITNQQENRYILDIMDELGYKYNNRCKFSFNHLFIDNLACALVNILEANIFTIFMNGLGKFVNNFLSLPLEVGHLFGRKLDENNLRLITNISMYINEFVEDPANSTYAIYKIKSFLLLYISNKYFDFISTIIFEKFVERDKLAKCLAESQGITFEKVLEEQYDSFIYCCLTEIAKSDIDKIMEIVERNTVYTLWQSDKNCFQKPKLNRDQFSFDI